MERPPPRPEPERAAKGEPPTTRASERAPRPGSAEPEAAVPEGAAPPSAFPPPNVAPPYARSASAGDGTWTPIGNLPGERGAVTPPLVVRTRLHPHPESRFITVTVGAIDLGRATLRFTPGTEDLVWAKLPVNGAAGLVPEAERDSLVLVMNGGFQPKHGRWGMIAGKVAVTPPREGACTIVIDASGAVRIRPWEALASTVGQVESLRQTPPCLVDEGAVHPALIAGRDKPWAGHKADLKTRRRSAIGIDPTGTILFYAIGEEAEPRWLAEGLRLAGAASAAELDINWYWTRFLLFGTGVGDKLRVTSTLIPKMEHHTYGYVERPSTRDFFYVLAKKTSPR